MIDSPAVRVLLVEDNPGDARLLAEILREAKGGPFELTIAGTLTEGRARHGEADVVLLDLSLPDAHGLETLRSMLDAAHDVPVVVLTGNADDDLAAEAVHAGAQDYLVKGDITPVLISRTIRYAIERKRAEENARKLVAADVAREKSEEAARRAQFLADVGTIVASTLDFDETARRLVRAIVPTLADYCVIDAVGDDGKVSRVAVAARDPVREAVLRELRPYAPGPQHPRAPSLRAMRERQTLVYPSFDEKQLREIAPDEAYVALVRALAPISIVAVPMIARDRVVGALSVVYTEESSRRHAPDEVLVAEEIARRAAVAIDNARLYGQAHRAVRARDEVLAVVSHDLRNPLSIFGLTLQQMRATTVNDPMRRELLVKAERAYARMNRLLDDLLDVSRIDQGSLPVDAQRVDLRHFLAEFVDLQRPLAAQKGLSIEGELGRAELWVSVDRERIAQVMSNLVGNAIKFTPTGGTIRVRARRLADFAEISVSDTGPGIAAEQLPHVFDRFWQGATKNRGVGLGLAIAKGIVEAHGGRIAASSTPGAGATFTLTLPLSRSGETRVDDGATGA